MLDLPPDLPERIACWIQAAVRYEVLANILLAIAEKEGGKPGQWVRNANNTYDVGPMQFNTTYLSSLAKYGINPIMWHNQGVIPMRSPPGVSTCTSAMTGVTCGRRRPTTIRTRLISMPPTAQTSCEGLHDGKSGLIPALPREK